MLHPQAKALLELIASRNLPPFDALTPAEARAFYRERRFFTQPDAPGIGSVAELSAPGPHGAVPLRGYRPAGSDPAAVLPVLVYYHGGGWTIGDLDTHDVLCRQLANGSGWMVVAVDYRMGPEHRFPAAVDDAVAALRWVADNAATLKVDPRRIAIGGDSAGGNLAAVVALIARDGGAPKPVLQLLIYPATDMEFRTESHRVNGTDYLLTTALMVWFRGNYLRDERDRADWRASPLLAADLAGVAPAALLTAGYDPLRDEGKAYADRLKSAGVDVLYRCWDGQVHGFITYGRVLDEANEAVSWCVDRLKAVA